MSNYNKKKDIYMQIKRSVLVNTIEHFLKDMESYDDLRLTDSINIQYMLVNYSKLENKFQS